MSRVVTGLGALVCAGIVAVATVHSQEPARPLLPATYPDSFVCGTSPVRSERLGLRRLETAADGQPLWFVQEPALLTAQHEGAVRFNEFLVAGDHATMRFKLFSSSEIETWQRVGTRLLDGRTVSVFSPSWGERAVSELWSLNRAGWDRPWIYWGEVLPGDTAPGDGFDVNLRVGFDNLPVVRVTRLADDVQFSSHVVNIVVPGVGNGRLASDDHDFSEPRIAQKFYEHFEDSYDVLAIVPHEVHLSSYGAFHRTVKNEVRGIGDTIHDSSSRYGSRGTLKAVEVYMKAAITDIRSAAHETAHQWGAFIDWNRLTGVIRAGHQPSSHDPLWTGGESLLAGVLFPTRRVRQTDAGWKVEATPGPAQFHPVTRYTMGILPKEQVPEIAIFEQQDQFSLDAVPAVDADVVGGVKTATIYNVIGMLGERQGPVPTEWRRATVVVSRDRLLSQAEMNYWTFHAQRSEDPNGTGVVGWDGMGSFDAATGRAIDLKTAIRPKSAPAIDQPLEVDFPDLPASGWRGVQFDAPVKTRYRTNDLIRLSGRVTARDRNDFNQILLYFIPAEGQGAQPLQVWARVSSAGTFIADFRFDAIHRGRHRLGVHLYWPGSGGQYPRTALSTIVVE